MKLKTYEKLLLCFAALVIAFSAGFLTGRLTAENRIVIETSSAAPSPVSDTGEDIEKVNINSASADELASLPGIGGGLADSIITYREAHGGFESIGEIMNVDGIGSGKYEQIRNYITV